MRKIFLVLVLFALAVIVTGSIIYFSSSSNKNFDFLRQSKSADKNADLNSDSGTPTGVSSSGESSSGNYVGVGSSSGSGGGPGGGGGGSGGGSSSGGSGSSADNSTSSLCNKLAFSIRKSNEEVLCSSECSTICTIEFRNLDFNEDGRFKISVLAFDSGNKVSERDREVTVGPRETINFSETFEGNFTCSYNATQILNCQALGGGSSSGFAVYP